MSECMFCDLDDPGLEIVFRNDLVVFSRSQRHQGSLKHSGVISPRAHRRTAFDLTVEEWTASRELLLRVKDWMDSRYAPDGYNLGWNCESTAGQEVMHAHLHVIPRFAHEPLAGQGIRTLLKSEANRW